MRALIAVLSLVLSNAVSALTPAQWRSQSVYQVLTDRFAHPGDSTAACSNLNNYCGGNWQGIIKHLDYIQGMGFTAIWISPVVENIDPSVSTQDGESYHGYWAQNIYAVNPAFGTSADLKALSDAVHKRGMYLMVDVVTNHMGYPGCGNCVNYNDFTPFNQQSYYHPFCIIDYNNATSVQQCWEGDNIVSLPDLRTEDSNVLSMWETWITQLVSNYSIDGLRVDSMQQVDQAFWKPWLSAAGDIYAVGEVFNGDPSYTCPYQNYLPGVLNYPAYFWITQAFQSTSGSISNLVNGVNQMKSTCSDTTLLGSFLENHDNARFPSLTSDISLDKNAIGFAMLQDGIPIVYAGQEQHYSGGNVPNNREDIWRSGYSTSSTLYVYIKALNAIRSLAIQKDSSYLTYKAYPTYSDSRTIVMRKGQANPVISVFTNSGSSGSYSFTLASSSTGFSAGQSVTDILTCAVSTTDSSGNLNVAISGGLPKVFYPTSALSGSSLCASSATTLSTARTSSSGATATSSCKPAATIAVTFNEMVTTAYGETIKISGNTTQLGSWNTNNAIALSASQYTSSNPLWSVTLNMPYGQAIQYKFIRVSSSGTVTFEADPNHTLTVTAPACATATTVSSSFQK